MLYLLLERCVQRCRDERANSRADPVNPVRAMRKARHNSGSKRSRGVEGTAGIVYREQLTCEERETDADLGYVSW